jgi:hypothetical protein
MKNTKAAKAAKPETVKSLQDLTAPVKPENPTSPVPPADQPEEAQPAAQEQPAARQMTDEEFVEFMGKATGRPDLVKAIMAAAANAGSEPAKEAEPAKEQIDLEQLKAIVSLVSANKAEHVNAEVVEDDDDEDDDDEFEDDYIWNPDPAWETAGWVLGSAALVGLGVLIGYLATK